jgi:hypothetical protein
MLFGSEISAAPSAASPVIKKEYQHALQSNFWI